MERIVPCKCVQISKVPLPGKLVAYQYTFKCTMSDGRTRKATLVESDDKRAKMIAEIKVGQALSKGSSQ